MSNAVKIPWVERKGFVDHTSLVAGVFDFQKTIGARKVEFSLFKHNITFSDGKNHLLEVKTDTDLKFSFGCTKDQAEDFILNLIASYDPEKIPIDFSIPGFHFSISVLSKALEADKTLKIPNSEHLEVEFKVFGIPLSFKDTIAEIYETAGLEVKEKAEAVVLDKFDTEKVLSSFYNDISEKLERFSNHLKSELEKILEKAP